VCEGNRVIDLRLRRGLEQKQKGEADLLLPLLLQPENRTWFERRPGKAGF
jgi:hypothetical protein